MARLATFLWFDDRAEEAVGFYDSLFADSEVVSVSRTPAPGLPGGQLVMGTIRICGHEVMIFNGGPGHPLTDAASLFLSVADQAELDRYWDALAEGGQPIACGWVRDRFGVTWQVVPGLLGELFGSPDREAAERARVAMMSMVKLDCAALQAAFDASA
jgi:predicted 3-demethylubiquinone-9 3-methyltransferase (glyoxalase superfamily)